MSRQELESQITAGKITFDRVQLKSELLGDAPGQKVTAKLQDLVAALSRIQPIRISSIIRAEGHHSEGRAVDIGNQEIASALLPVVAIPAKVAEFHIDELIFDATVAGLANNANRWNYDNGAPHAYDAATLAAHRNHIHFSVLAG